MSAGVAERITRIPDPAEPVPAVAWPTVALLVVGLAGWLGSSAAFLTGALPWWATVALNAVTGYLLFTVAHDAAHHAASSDSRRNTWLGRLSTPFFAPHAAFPVWRFIHMQHHRFTNHDDGRDPDGYTMRGPSWQMPLRWLTIDGYYLVFYARHWSSRPTAERREELVQVALSAATLVALAVLAGPWALVVIVLLPGRLAILWLAYAFDFLPHHGLHHKPGEDRLKTTRNRVGGERWVSPLLLYQNYHLVHHLHPVVPFYRYLAVWRRNEQRYLEGDPALSTLGGRPLTVEEYRRLRELAEH
jgi:ring-1,2-phenylacetyl-CoA epoxidase subunit PaaE